jgi:putative copper export protein
MADLSAPARLLGYVASLGITGAAAFRVLVRHRVTPQYPEAAGRLLARTRNVAIVLAFLLLAATVWRLFAQALGLVDPDQSLFQVMNFLSQSTWGTHWMIQAAAAIVGLLAVAINRDGRVLLPFALLYSFLAPLTGHASENPWGQIPGILIHGLHQLGGGVWLGTLAMVVVVGYGGTRDAPPDSRHRIIASLVEGFSPMALAGVSVAVVAGGVLALQYVGSWHALQASGYGRTLLIKVALLLLTAMLGAWNWQRVRPRLGEPGASAHLFRSATLELVIGTVLLAATALLVGLEAPGLG